MTKAFSFVVAVLFVLIIVQSAISANLPEPVSTERSAESRSEFSASNGRREIWNEGFVSVHNYPRDQYGWERTTVVKYNRTVESDRYFNEGIALAKWAIAIIIIVPLLVLIGIVALLACVCKVCSRKKVKNHFVLQEAPSPYPSNATMKAG